MLLLEELQHSNPEVAGGSPQAPEGRATNPARGNPSSLQTPYAIKDVYSSEDAYLCNVLFDDLLELVLRLRNQFRQMISGEQVITGVVVSKQ